MDQVQKLLKEPHFTIIDDHIFFSKAYFLSKITQKKYKNFRIFILKKFKKEDICENLLRNEILNLEKSIQNEENKQLFFEYCEDYFLNILIKLKDPNYIKNELNIIKNEEIRNVPKILNEKIIIFLHIFSYSGKSWMRNWPAWLLKKARRSRKKSKIPI